MWYDAVRILIFSLKILHLLVECVVNAHGTKAVFPHYHSSSNIYPTIFTGVSE